ncbi:MAG: lectin-like protein [Candidatus Ornithomonoglobus sp.]
MKKRAFILFIALSMVTTMFLDVTAIATSEDTIEYLAATGFNGNSYAVINKKLNWKDAKEYCEQLGGHLVTITSAEEDKMMYQLTKESGNKGMLLGASDLSGEWEWVTGEKWDYTNWYPGEPNSQNEHYLSYHGNCGSQWNDWNEVPWYFICEWEENNNFQVDKYRANYLINSKTGATMEDTYINISKTPCRITYETGQENGLDDAASAWSAVMNTLNSIDNPSSITEYAFEEKDMYSAIIMSLFESSVDYKLMGYIDNEITKQSKSLVSTVTSSMKSLYNFDVIDASAVSKMTEKQKEDFEKELKDAYNEVHESASNIADVTKIINTGIKVGKGVQDICETIEVYKNIRNLSDSMKQIMKNMYTKCPNDNLALKSALLECISVMDSGEKVFTAQMTAYSACVVGKNVAQVGIDKLWGSVKTSFSVANPAAFAFQVSYNIGKYVTQACFNSDGIEEKYCNLVAMINIEEVLNSVYYDVKNSFKVNQTEEDAKIYNSAVEVMFNMINTDCDYATAFANAVDSSLAGKISAAFGDSNVEDYKNSVKSIQSSTSLFHVAVQTDWVAQLYEDNIGKYFEYEHLIDEAYENYSKKYNINCPVDIYVYDSDDNVIASVINNNAYCEDNADITVVVNGDKKTVYTYSNDYRIDCVGNDTGKMNITITEYDSDGELSREANFNNVALNDGLQYTLCTINNYTLQNNDGSISADYDTNNGSSNTHKMIINRGYFTDTMAVSDDICIGKRVSIAAYVPDGYVFDGWTSDSDDNIFEDASNMNTTVYMPDSDVTVTAKVIAADTLKKDFETTADSGYFANAFDEADKEGIISFNSFFDAYNIYSDNITQYGIYIYKTGDEENKVTLSAQTVDELVTADGKFYATVENIPSEKFDAETVAVPYIVLNGNIITGNACSYSVSKGNKWLGAKPTE